MAMMKDRLLSMVTVAVLVTLVVSTFVSTGRQTTDGAPRTRLGALPPEPPGGPSNEEILEAFLDPALLEAVPVGPEEVAEPVQVVLSGSRVVDALGESGIPEVALWAYKKAESELDDRDPSCGLPWELLAALGRVESNHGRFGGAQLRADGYGTRPIRGIPLDGRPNVARILDTDNGVLDGDTTYDRAVGPMQFIPGTWRGYSADGNDDRKEDPNNIYDAAEGAGVYLCAGDTNLRNGNQLYRAIRRYNNADSYARVVLNLLRLYQSGQVMTVPYSPPPAEPPTGQPSRQPSSSPAPRPSAPTPSAPSTPTATASSPAPVPVPPTTTAPSPTLEPTTTPPVEPTGEPPVEPTGEPMPTVTAGPTPTGTPSGTATPTDGPETAAVGWAPAMREIVLRLLQATAPSTAAPTPPPG